MSDHPPCFCRACVPTTAPIVCSRCGQEVRWGSRNGDSPSYLHREPVEHFTILGHSAPMPMGRSKDEEQQLIEDDPLQRATIEVLAHDVAPEEFSPQSGIRQIANLVSGVTRVMPNGKASKSPKHPPMAPGWELISLRHARGPYRGSKGEVLSISDTHVLRARARRVDGSIDIVVASWRDLSFDFAFIGTIENGLLSPRKVGSDELKDWIKTER